MKPKNWVYVGGPLLDPPDEPEDGELTTEERRQKAFDDFDPPDAEYGDSQ